MLIYLCVLKTLNMYIYKEYFSDLLRQLAVAEEDKKAFE